MECLRCQHENRLGRRFCAECGGPLAPTCPACHSQNEPGEKFCGECGTEIGGLGVRGLAVRGHAESPTRNNLTTDTLAPRAHTPKHLAEKILKSRSALEGERKQVTVLFADVQGSMELAERMDPEEWSQIMQRFFGILSEGVERFEGFVDKFTGDGIMALFGAPIAHEDHAQRACFAALHLRDALKTYSDELRLTRGLDFAVRVGINTGDVVVGTIGDDLRMDYTAQGHTVGLAQRMEQMAAAQSICIGEATAYLVSGYLALRDLGTATVKGASSPIRVFGLVGPGPHRTRLEVARSRGLTRFVGRDMDLQALEAALAQACAGNGQVVGVAAEAGTGKSRLCFEFVQRCRTRGISINEGHCPAHGKTVPYLPVLEMLRDIFEIGDRDSDHESRRKIAGELRSLDASFEELLPLVFDFLGVPDPERPASQLSPEARQRQLIAFMRHLTEARSRRAPRVLLVDDVHWIDPASDAFFAQAIEAANATRTLWLVNFRPEYHADWMGRSFYRQLRLLPLGPDAIAELVADLLGRDPSLAGLAEKIYERTRGNPFFVEEVVLSLVEDGALQGRRGAYRLAGPIAALGIPGTVQAVLAARVDRLPDREKALLQTASVIGKELPEPVLRRVAGLPEPDLASALAALVRAEFLFERALYPEAEYAFRHPLTHQVTYESQLATQRSRTHSSVARAVEEVDADRLDERAALLAYHWEEAGDAAMAARWHARAARRLFLDSLAEALRHWSRVWVLLAGAQDSQDVAIRLEAAGEILFLGEAIGFEDQTARAILTEGLNLAAREGDLRSRALLLINFAAGHVTGLGELSGGEDELEEAFALAMQGADPELRFRVHEAKIDFLQFSGRLPEAAALGDDYVRLACALQPATIARVIPAAWAIGRRAMVWTEMGRLDAAADSMRECAKGLRESGSIVYQAYAEAVWAENRMLAGDTDGARSHARRAVELADKVGGSLARVYARDRLGSVLVHAGEWHAAEAELGLALDLARQARSWLLGEASILAHLAEARLGAGDAEQAHRTALEAIQAGRRRQTPVWEAQAHLALARVLLVRFGANAQNEIESALGECGALVERTEARVYEPHIHEVRADRFRLLDDVGSRLAELREAHRLFTEMGATGHAERVAKELGG
jgi:class 3 adenylate cyclase